MNPFFGSVALLPLEQLLNGLLQQDQHSLQSLAEHAGKVLEIESTRPPAAIMVTIQSSGVKLYGGSATTIDQQFDARVSASLADLSQLLFRANSSQSMANPNIKISGDAEFVQDVYRIAGALELDWESQLGNVFGDVAIAQFSQFFNQALSWSKQSFKSSTEAVDEYLHEELRVVPAAAEVEQFSDQLDELKLSIDRLTVRKDKLRQRLDALTAEKLASN